MPTALPADRIRAWVQASWRLSSHARDRYLVSDVQDVGYLELTIERLEAEFGTQGGQDITQARSLSRMWLLAFYEALRTYRSACAKHHPSAWRPFAHLFRLLNNIREPLAKHEVAGQRVRHVPDPTYTSGVGIGWAYFDPSTKTYEQTSRREIADLFLKIAGELPSAGEADAVRQGVADDEG
jgi:hypothetical protein